MRENGGEAVRLGRFKSMRYAWDFLADPLDAMRRAFEAHGPLVIAELHLPLETNGKILILAVGAAFNKAVLGDPQTWRTVSIGPGGPKNSAARRLAVGIVRMGGQKHAHYRKLLVPPLRRPSVEALGEDMLRLGAEEIDRWPLGEPIDLSQRARRLIRTFAIGLLFGDDRERGLPIADMISNGLELNWSVLVSGCPINLPFTPYGKMVRKGEALERCILDWAAHKQGNLDPHDLLSVVVNNPDENGNKPTDLAIAAHVPTLFGAAYETCQNALIWTLVLLAQHPKICCDLYDELRGASAGSPPSLARIIELPLLDAVVRESMRILPPVPTQYRVAECDTVLAGNAVPHRARVILSAFLTNRLPDLYPEADRFQPGRWANIEPTPFEYLVFSGGPRSCPGSTFGLSMIKVGISTIFQRFRIALAPGQSIDYRVRVALSPRRPVAAKLHRQDGAFSAVPVRGSIHKLVRLPA